MSLLLRLLITVGVVGLALGARTLNGLSRKDAGFDYFLLVRQWPGNYCSKQSCPTLVNDGFRFTIHGLWPQNKNGSYPQYCNSSLQFNLTTVADLAKTMEKEWPSLGTSELGADASFWEHEWEKHGTCSLSVFPDEQKYFKNILQLHKKYDLAAALRAAAILPNATKTYRNKTVTDAIKNKYGVEPVLLCYNNQLAQVYMCLDKALTPFSCNATLLAGGSACKQQFSIPPVNTSTTTTISSSAPLPITGHHRLLRSL